MKRLAYLILLLLCTGFWACKKELPNGMEAGYFKVFDDQAANNQYKVLDLKETSDGGALILCSLNHTQAFLLRCNEKGEYVTSTLVDAQHKHPLPTLLQINGNFYVACMDEVGLFTRILHIDESTGATSVAAEFPTLLYPLAWSANTDGSLLLLSYDRYGFRSELSKLSLDGQTDWTVRVNVYQDAEEMVVHHLNGTGKQFPFYTTAWNGKFVANCFNNYSFSFLVFSAGNNTPDAIYNGSHYSSGTTAMLPLDGSSAALARFSFGKSYLIPSFDQSAGVVSLTDDMGGLLVEEAEDDSEFEFGKVSIDGTTYLCYAYNTQNGRVSIGFMSSTGELKARKYFGSSNNPFKIGHFIQTQDKGLMVAGSFYVAGAFPRPAIFKLNEKELFEMMGLVY